MIKILLLILALAAYGGHVLYEKFTGGDTLPDEVVQTAQEASSTLSVKGVTNLTLKAVKAAGLEVSEIPATGCSSSAISPERVEALISLMSGPQKTAVAALLDGSSTVWSAQLYNKDGEVGLCLPTHNALLMLPIRLDETSLNALKSLVPDVIPGK